MKLYRILILFVAIAAGICGVAARTVPTAASIIDKCAAKIKAAPSVQFKFTLTYGNTKSACDIIIAKQKYRLSSSQMEVWYDGTTQWTYASAQKELSITEPTADELLECNPFAILSHYDKAYKCRRLQGPDYEIELVSKSKTATVRKAVVSINPSTMMPSKLVVTLSNGHTFTATVGTAKTGKALPSSTFVYDKKKFPASEIIDLR